MKRSAVDAKKILLDSGLNEEVVSSYLKEDDIDNVVKLGIKDLFFYSILILTILPIYLSAKYSLFFGVEKLLIPLILFIVVTRIKGMNGALFLFVLSHSAVSSTVVIAMGIKDEIIDIPLESVFEISLYFIIMLMICSLYSFLLVFLFFKRSFDRRLANKKESLAKKILEGFHRWRQTEYRSYLESINPRYSGYIYLLLYSKTNDVFYVGQTSDIKRRIREHKRNKFKEIDFYYKVVESKIDIFRIDDRERFWISNYGGKETLKNETGGGSSIYKRTNSRWMEKVTLFENKHSEFYKS